ncbi:MAG: hypothetical protein ACOC08_04415 [Campylobacterales bacterium]
MTTLGIRNLQLNPATLTGALENDDYTLITKHSTPIGLAVGFDSKALDFGFRNFLALRAFRQGDIGVGELAKVLQKSREETISMLGDMGIPIATYDPSEDEEIINELLD